MQEIRYHFISIITPVYNREDCITRCIESVQRQDFKNYEHIIIDDGSSDRTKEIIQNFSSSNPQIKCIIYNVNKGVNYARNRGIEYSVGEYVLFLDSDDYLENSALSIIEKKIKDNPNYTHYLFNVSDRQNDKNLPMNSHEYNYEDWIKDNVYGDFCHIVKRNLLIRFPFFENFRLYESLNWFRILKAGEKQLYIPTIIDMRERKRNDALIKESFLFKKNAIENEYLYLTTLFEFFQEDYKKFAIIKYNKLLKNFILFGLALSKYDEIYKYINNYNFIYRIIYFFKLGFILKFSIRGYSFVKNQLLK